MAIYELENRIFYDAAMPEDVSAADSEDASSESAETAETAEDIQPDTSQSNPDTSQSDTEGSGQETDTEASEEEHEIYVGDDDELSADDLSELDEYGHDVDIHGDYAVVSAAGQNENAGAVYVFIKKGDSWVLLQKLTASDGAAGDNFGSSVSIDGDFIVIGAEGDDDNGTDSGSVYVFKLNDGIWSEQAKISAGNDGAAGDGFGCSVDIDGDQIVIGAWGDDDLGENSGSAYVFNLGNEGWQMGDKLQAGDGSTGASFGWDVAIDDNDIAVGAIGDNGSGAVYVFNQNGSEWVESSKLVGNDTTTGDLFGWDVDIDDGTIAVGAIGDDDQGENSGSVYLFKQESESQWSEHSKLTDDRGHAGNHFGYSVSLDGDHLAVGSVGADFGAGGVFVYNYHSDINSWVSYKAIFQEDGTQGDMFGAAVALEGDDLIIGSPGQDSAGQDSGAAYGLEHPDTPEPEPPGPTPDPDEPPPINDGTDTGPGTSPEDPLSEEGEDETYEEGLEEGDEADQDEDIEETPGQGNGSNGAFDFGQITPPQNSSEVVFAEMEQVEYFDMENMGTAFQLPNGEYQVNIDPELPDDIFEVRAEGAFESAMGDAAGEQPPSTENLEHVLVEAEAAAVQDAQDIVDDFAGSDIEGTGAEERDPVEGDQQTNDDVSNAIDSLFLSGFNVDDTDDIEVDEKSPEKAEKPGVFKDAFDKSLDAILNF